MLDLSRRVLNNRLIRDIRDLIPHDAYLVGGCVRDMLLGKDPLDFDFVSFSPIEDMASQIADRMGSRPFWMDEKRGVMRIAIKAAGLNIDISRPKGADIWEDLLSRDITINAMAFDITRGAFLDPAAGLDDLLNGTIRLISEKNLRDDPLRALRAVRFSVTLDFGLRGETSGMIRKNADLLREVSPERIRLEFSRALDSIHSAKFFRLLTWTDLSSVLFPEAVTGVSDPRMLWHPVFCCALPLCMEMDGLLYSAQALMPGSREFLEEETESGVKRGSLLRLSAFLLGLREARKHGEGILRGDESLFAQRARDFCASLRFSSRSCRMVGSLLGRLSLSSAVISGPGMSALDMHRFCDEEGDRLPEALLLALVLAQNHD
ncbi:CCA tRNA nucleotidyltransferase, partial [bacterium]|nr:CCA tRNA nucleotidyltransferase [bacterium]